jgi:hypothetical protein
MLYGAERAQQLVLTHPNNQHLVKVLEQTRTRLVAGEKFGGNDSDSGMVSDNADSWPSDQQSAYPSNPNETFDDDALLTDDEINKENQGGMSPQCAIELIYSIIYSSESWELGFFFGQYRISVGRASEPGCTTESTAEATVSAAAT